MRDLRSHGGEVPDRVARGESLVVTRDGADVAELRPRPRPTATATELVARRRTVPAVDPADLRADIDELLDPTR